jgi:hypothetical protein
MQPGAARWLVSDDARSIENAISQNNTSAFELLTTQGLFDRIPPDAVLVHAKNAAHADAKGIFDIFLTARSSIIVTGRDPFQKDRTFLLKLIDEWRRQGPLNSYYVQRLCEAGANVNLVDSEGDTALTLAILHNNLQVVKTLVENRADLDMVTRDSLGNRNPTAFRQAFRTNEKRAIYEYLFLAGARIGPRHRHNAMLPDYMDFSVPATLTFFKDPKNVRANVLKRRLPPIPPLEGKPPPADFIDTAEIYKSVMREVTPQYLSVGPESMREIFRHVTRREDFAQLRLVHTSWRRLADVVVAEMPLAFFQF